MVAASALKTTSLLTEPWPSLQIILPPFFPPKGWCSTGHNLEASCDHSVPLLPHSLGLIAHSSARPFANFFLYFTLLRLNLLQSSLASNFLLELKLAFSSLHLLSAGLTGARQHT